jgi:hypothetical protein
METKNKKLMENNLLNVYFFEIKYETENCYTMQERVGIIYEKAYIISARDPIEITDNAPMPGRSQ